MHPTLFETVKIKDGKIFNLDWHNQRFNRTQKELFLNNMPFDLSEFISPPPVGLYRCKIIYTNNKILSVDYFPYEAKKIKTLKVIQSQLDYEYKYTNRSMFEELLKDYNEILIEKDGLLTDTTIANIAFLEGDKWITPKRPLLKGTTRARLIEEGFLQERDIKKEVLKNYSNFALMNAMIGFQIQKSANIQI